MALFSDNREQTKQDERIQFRRATGFNKTKLALMGYKDDGTMNAFGGVINAIDPGLAAQQRLAARKMYGKNSDVGRTMRETDKEYLNQRIAQVDFAGEVVKTIFTAGAGGAAAGAAGGGGAAAGAAGGGAGAGLASSGAAASGAGAGAMAGGSSAGASSALSSAGSGAGLSGASSGAGTASSALGSGGGDMASVFSGGGGGGAIDPSVADSGMSSSLNSSGDIVTSGGDPYADALDSDVGNKLTDMKEQSDVENTKDQLKEQIEKKAKEEAKNQSKNKKDEEEDEEDDPNKKIDKALESAPALISKGHKLYKTTKAYYDEEDRVVEEALSRKTKPTYGNTL